MVHPACAARARIELRDGDTFVNSRVIYSSNYRTTTVAGAAHTARLICCDIRKTTPTTTTTAAVITITTSVERQTDCRERMCVLACCLFAVTQTAQTRRSQSRLTIYKFVYLSMRLTACQGTTPRRQDEVHRTQMKNAQCDGSSDSCFYTQLLRYKHVPTCRCVFMQMLINILLLL